MASDACSFGAFVASSNKVRSYNCNCFKNVDQRCERGENKEAIGDVVTPKKIAERAHREKRAIGKRQL